MFCIHITGRQNCLHRLIFFMDQFRPAVIDTFQDPIPPLMNKPDLHVKFPRVSRRYGSAAPFYDHSKEALIASPMLPGLWWPGFFGRKASG